MSIQIKSDRKETENKTIRFPVDMLARIEEGFVHFYTLFLAISKHPELTSQLLRCPQIYRGFEVVCISRV